MATFEVQVFVDDASKTAQYVMWDSDSKEAALLDTVLDYDAGAGAVSKGRVNQLLAFVEEKALKVTSLVDTHVHADHLSGVTELKSRLPDAQTLMGTNVVTTQSTFKPLYNMKQLAPDGSQWDRLLAEGDTFNVGSFEVQAWHTPGHTADSMSYYVPQAGAIFCGDTLFYPDCGSARCDFPNGDARQLWDSISRIMALPDETKIYLCHDYPKPDREFQHMVTVKQQREENIHLVSVTTADEFVAMRTARDATLNVPHLLYPSIQVNIAAGALPEAEDNGKQYLKIPLTIKSE